MSVLDVAAALPSIEVLRERCRSLAMLERIVGGDLAYGSRTGWGAGEAAMIDDGGGDDLTVVLGPDGVFVAGPEEYLQPARVIPEAEVGRAAVEHVLAGRPLSDAVVRALNPGTSLAAVRADVVATGYPVAEE